MRWKNFIWQKQVNRYKSIYKQYDKYFYKNFSRKRLTANLFKRIVRVFAADEAAVMKQFKRSLTKQITDKCECLGPHTV
ncbi:unnamed protein product [Neisseria lactamica Y92-1009]|uniref:Uncharacterized protein n=2 Tax=Neisseria lactamica TaxID=486 RepID=A0AAU8VR88_NEILA|nr:hypothetical protein B2G52_00765 [Neisseria lactamica]CBX23092.1 unnamed protein product [Neisseria lactamica Y92-1009]